MGLDIRLPLGYVFVIVGLIMTAYGVATWPSVDGPVAHPKRGES